MEQIQQVAATDSTVLLLGETGTGKELFATQIHELGTRRGDTMVRVNCGAIPATLIESELFGRERGAFTGALSRQVGRFELADHSTIFLDEIGDLPFEVQVKLLRVLEEHQIERLGSPRSIAVDTRIIAATHRNLEQRIAEGAFREDLVLPVERLPHSRAAAARTCRRHPAARVAVRRGVFERFWKAHRHDRQGQPRGAATPRVARQHPRAAQCGGAGDDLGVEQTPDHPACRRPPSRQPNEARGCSTSRKSTSAPCSKAPVGGFGARLGRPTSSG